ncbi:hypothetical protein KCU65_g6151, partial [Aureobasidium melanogenum]
MDPDDGRSKRRMAPHIKYKSMATSAEPSSSKTPISRLEESEKENEAQKIALAKLEEENEAQKEALSESQTELQAWKDFHAEGPTSSLCYDSMAYLRYPSGNRSPSPQTGYDKSVTDPWDGGENVHDLLRVKELVREGATHTRNTGREFQDEIERRTRGAARQCNHLAPWTDSAGDSVGEPVRVTYQDKFGKPGVLACEDRRGGFCRNDWPSMFHCLKCDTYFCRPCGGAHNFRPKWIVELEREYEATHEK